jgi:hypothetical protein
LRIGEHRITATGRGIVCYISNYSYIDDPSFVVARQRLSGEFDSIWIDCLNGDNRETGTKSFRIPTAHPKQIAKSNDTVGIRSEGVNPEGDKNDSDGNRLFRLYKLDAGPDSFVGYVRLHS